MAASKPDLMLLDVMMPDGDGFEVVRRMRSSGPDVPVIFLSARDGVRERVAGLALGGDDYVTKPFSLDEVLERIRAVLRRTGRAVANPRLRVADLELDEDGHEVRRDGTPIALTPTEFRLLRFLMLNAGRVLVQTARYSIMSGATTRPATAMWWSLASATCGARSTRVSHT